MISFYAFEYTQTRYIVKQHVSKLCGGGKKLQETKIHSEDNIIKSIRNFFKLKKENKVVKYTITKDTENLFELEEEGFRSNNYIDHKINGERNKNLSIID